MTSARPTPNQVNVVAPSARKRAVMMELPHSRWCKRCLILLLSLAAVSAFYVHCITSNFQPTSLTSPPTQHVSSINRLADISISDKAFRNVSKTNCSNICPTKFDPIKGYPAMAINAPCPDFVGVHTFRDLSDYVHYFFAHEDKGVLATVDILSAAQCLGPVPIVYSLCDYDQIKTVVWSFSKFFTEGFILVTGASDYPAPNQLTQPLLEEENLLHWFGQNPNIEHPKFSPIPIGIACSYWQHPKMLETARREILNIANTALLREEHILFGKYLKTIIQSIQSNNSAPLMAINFKNSNPIRQKLKDRYCSEDFVTCHDRVMMTSNPELYDVAQTYRKLLSVPFWLSPQGNGLDCYRTYEALYLHRIPIVQSSLLDPIYSKLPVLIVKDLFNITEAFLIQSLRDMAERTFSYEALEPDYWRRVVEDKRAELVKRRRVDVASYRERRRCWALKADDTMLY